MLRVTLDTGPVNHRSRIKEACRGLAVELRYTTVTNRETEGTGQQTNDPNAIGEIFVLDESRLDSGAVLG